MKFDPETHKYYDDNGTEYPSVTTLIGEAWPIDKRWFKPENAEYGIAVHELTAAIDFANITIDDLVGTEHYSACHSWYTFTQRLNPELVPMGVERPFIHHGLRFAGTVDRLWKLDGVYTLVDIKTGAPSKWHELQLGAYALGLKESDIEVSRGIVALVPREGATRIKEVDVQAGAEAFRALRRWQLYRESFR